MSLAAQVQVQPRSQVTATIPSGQSVSDVVDLDRTSLIGFIMPTAWTAADLTIEVSADNSRWVTGSVTNSDGTVSNKLTAPTADTAYTPDPVALLPFRYIRFRSGSAGSPVAQGADRAIVAITRPLA